MGKAWKPTDARKCAFIRCVMTRRVSPIAATTCCWREEEEGAQRMRLCRANSLPGTVLYPDSITDTGAEATAPLRARRHTWHAPSPPPAPHWQGGVCWGAIFKSLLCIRDVCFAAGGLQPVLPSHVTHISAEGEHGLKKTRNLDGSSNTPSAILFFLSLF